MPPLFDVKPLDRQVYETELRDWLPDTIFDVHTHVWLDAHKRHTADEFARVVSWPARVAKDSPIEELVESYRLLFPGKTCRALFFGNAKPGDDLDGMNSYVSDCARRTPGYAALIWAHPDWSADELERRIEAGGFVGAKVYLNYAPSYLPGAEVRIYDFFPPHQLAVLDRRGWIGMLHIPRPARLRDPVNLAQLREIDACFPRAKIILAHVGRAYCDGDVGNAFEVLGHTHHLRWDFSANTNANVFRQLLAAMGPERVLFGSDLPILRMRMRRIERDGRYVNLVPPGLYGDISNDPNMAEVSAAEGEQLTFFMYEELRAFKRAATAVGLTRDDLEDIFHRNAEALLADIAGAAAPAASRRRAATAQRTK